MSHLSGAAILVGKSSSNLLFVLLVQMAQLPFLLFAITLGGVAVDQIIAVFMLLVCLTFLLASIGLLLSVVSITNNRAIGATVVVAIAAATFVAARFEGIWSIGQTPLPFIDCAALVAVAVAGFLCSLLAFARETTVLHVEHSEQREPIPIREKDDPVTWKEYHFQCGLRSGRYFKLLLATGLFALGRADLLDQFAWSMWMAGLILIEFGYQVSGIFGEEYAQGTLATLYALPEQKGTIFDRKFTGRLRAIAPIYLIGAVLLLVIFPTGYAMMMGGGIGLMLVLPPYGMLCVMLSVHIQRHPMIIAGMSLGLLFASFGLAVLPAILIHPAIIMIWGPVVYIGLNVLLLIKLRERLAEVTGRQKTKTKAPKAKRIPPPLPRS